MAEVFIGLGTNLGNRLGLLRDAIERLHDCIAVVRISPVYETDPVGYLDQPRFLNVALKGTTRLEPHELLDCLQNIEFEMGRERRIVNGPRTIDLDLLFYGDLVIDSQTLIVPHPRLHERLFVLTPLEDIAPDFIHPFFDASISALKSRVDSEWTGEVLEADLSDLVSCETGE